jgi:hypothetical protein
MIADSLRPPDIRSATLEVLLDEMWRESGRIISVFYQNGDRTIRVAKTDPSKPLLEEMTFNLAPATYEVVLEDPQRHLAIATIDAVGGETVRINLTTSDHGPVFRFEAIDR